MGYGDCDLIIINLTITNEPASFHGKAHNI